MTRSNPTVSVVLPTYNRGDIIGNSIKSVLNQTFDDFELIIVDDASTDETDDVVGSFEDDRIEYLKHDKNEGAPAARNTGIEASRGDYVAFQDSDDEWLPSKLAKQMRVFQDSPAAVGVVYTGMRRVRNGESVYLPYSGVEKAEGDIHRSLREQNFISTQASAVRKKCFDRVGDFDEDAWPLSDWELWLRISEHFQFKLVGETLVTSQVRSDSISDNQRALAEARELIINKHKGRFDSKSLARHCFYTGNGFMKTNEDKKARKYLLRAIKIDPQLHYIAALLLSFSPTVYKNLYNQYKNLRVNS